MVEKLFLFCLFCFWNHLLIVFTSASAVSLSQKSAGNVWRQGRKKGTDVLNTDSPSHGKIEMPCWRFLLNFQSHLSWFWLFQEESVSKASAERVLRDCPNNPRHHFFGKFQILCVHLAKQSQESSFQVWFPKVKAKPFCWVIGESFRRQTWEQWWPPRHMLGAYGERAPGLALWESTEKGVRGEKEVPVLWGVGGVSWSPSLPQASHLMPSPHSTASGVLIKRKLCKYSSFLSWTDYVTLECQWKKP